MGGMDGFGEELEDVASFAGAGEDFYGRGLAAEEKDARVGAELADGDGRFDAVDVRHEDVREDELGAVALGLLDGFGAAVSSFGDEAVAVEDEHDGIGDELFIIDDEDAGSLRLFVCTVAGVRMRLLMG